MKIKEFIKLLKRFPKQTVLNQEPICTLIQKYAQNTLIATELRIDFAVPTVRSGNKILPDGIDAEAPSTSSPSSSTTPVAPALATEKGRADEKTGIK